MSYEYQELERKISDLERKVSDLDYDMRRAVDELHDMIVRKADRHHSHEGSDT
jgi:hypothetical protein